MLCAFDLNIAFFKIIVLLNYDVVRKSTCLQRILIKRITLEYNAFYRRLMTLRWMYFILFTELKIIIFEYTATPLIKFTDVTVRQHTIYVILWLSSINGMPTAANNIYIYITLSNFSFDWNVINFFFLVPKRITVIILTSHNKCFNYVYLYYFLLKKEQKK